MKNKFTYITMLAILIVAANQEFFAQDQNQEDIISGTVTDFATGEPLPGVNVLIKGTATGTITDINGAFTLSAAEGTTISVSFIGYETQEFTAAAGQNFTIKLQIAAEELEEIIVIGYGTQKKEDKTGAVYSVSSGDLQTIAIQDPIESIQGKVPGVTIRKSGSDPNAGFDVKIRGSSGITSSTNPLYVVDGVVGVDPTTISVDDIESFNVLKDASSAAIYGSRGANGVIIINTKRGSSVGSLIEYNGYMTVEQVSNRSRLDLMTANEFRDYGNKLGIAIRDLGENTDWQEVIYRTGLSYNQTVAFSGGNEKSSYRASVSNNRIAGVIKNSEKQRTILRLNAQTKGFNDKLTLSMNVANTIENNNYVNYGSPGADGTLFQAFQRNPTIPVKNPDGTFFQDGTSPVNNYSNPAAILHDIQNERYAKRFLGNIKTGFDVIDGLKITLSGAYTRDDDERFYFEPSGNEPLPGEGRAERRYDNNDSKLFEIYTNYDKLFGKHKLILSLVILISNSIGTALWQEEKILHLTLPNRMI